MTNQNVLKNFVYFFLFLIPIGFVFSVVIIEMLFLLFLITFFFFSFKKYFFSNEFEKYYIIFFFIFSLYIALNGLINIENDPHLLKSFTFFRYFLLITLFFVIKKIYKFKYFSFVNFFIFCLFVLSIDVLIQSVLGFNILGYKVDSGYTFSRISGLFKDEFILGSFLFNFSWLIFIFLFKNKKKNQIKNILVLGLLICAIIFTGERSATIKFFMFFCLIFLFVSELRLMLAKSFLVGILIFTSVIFIQFNFTYENYYKKASLKLVDKNSKITIKNVFDRYYFLPVIKDLKFLKVNVNNTKINLEDKSLNKKKPELNKNKNQIQDLKITNLEIKDNNKLINPLSGHLDLFENAILIAKNNIVFGTGLKTFRNMCFGKIYEFSNSNCSTHPHNYYLEIISELGVIGIILFLIFIILIFNKKFIIENKKYKTLLILFLVCFLFPFQTTGSFFNNYNSFIFFFILSNYFYLSNNRV